MFSFLYHLVDHLSTSFVLMWGRAVFSYIFPRCVKPIKLNSWDIVTNSEMSIFRETLSHCKGQVRPQIMNLQHITIQEVHSRERCQSLCWRRENSGPPEHVVELNGLKHSFLIRICNFQYICTSDLEHHTFVLLCKTNSRGSHTIVAVWKSKVSQMCFYFKIDLTFSCTVCLYSKSTEICVNS